MKDKAEATTTTKTNDNRCLGNLKSKLSKDDTAV